MWCWGRINDPEDEHPNPVPTKVGSETDWAHLSGGGGHYCGIKTDGTLWCWGQLPWADLASSPALQDFGITWKRPEMAYNINCAIAVDNTLWCWGRNSLGQLGNGTTEDSNTPGEVPVPWP
ncbi:MAG: hypothetical protein JRI25_22950 [Deltaproteobacteria bacterium]|nr:hypothetical protein [Deltaproteobacteria bacterium]